MLVHALPPSAPTPVWNLSGMLRRSASLTIPHRKSFASIASVRLRLYAHEDSQPKSTRKRNHTRTQKLTLPKVCVFWSVAFLSAFCRPLRGEQRAPENATHRNTQILETVNFLRFRVCYVFGFSLFSSEFWFLTFCGSFASHASNPYLNRSRIVRYNATTILFEIIAFLIRKPLSHVTVITKNSWEFLRKLFSCNCILQENQGNCNCNAN